MTWAEYVAAVMDGDSQLAASRRTGVDQSTLSRWSVGKGLNRLSPHKVRAFARGYDRPALEAFVEAFHDPETGRLDAARVAAAYRISLSALARGLRVTQSALSKRPTAAAAQGGLRELEFVWATLLDLLRTEERVRGWLNTNRADLGGRAPIDLLAGGSVEALVNYIRSVVAGEPG